MDYQLVICQGCFSKERKLFPIRNLQSSFVNKDVIKLNINSKGGVCWECKKNIIKFSRFRKQVEFCQKTLLDLDKLQTVQCLSSLTISPIHIFEYQCTSSDPLTAEIQEIETKEIKQEIEPKIDADFDFDETTQVEHEVYVQENEVKVKKGKKNKIKSKKKTKVKTKVDYASDLDDVKDKFVEVEFTEEEMLKSREEKRSHPNFKKLPYHCGTCVLGFTRKENYDLHLVKKHEKSVGTHICPVCQVRFASLTSLTKHVKKHYHCYHCKLCTYETTELWSALSHCRTKHSADSEDCIHCPQCSYVAKTREEMAEHRKTHTLVCNECGEKFKGQNTLKTHIRRIHGTVREHLCPACPKAFRSRGRLEAHMAGHGAGVAARLAYCARCQVQYKNIYVYRNHLSTSANHSEKRYHCEVCNKKFASKVYYKRHYTFYHQKSSPFKCELCNRLFISEWRLRNHRQMQHGLARTRNHACNVCGNKFYTRSTLAAHELTHSSARSFMCEDCGDTFKQRPALYTHARLLHRANSKVL
ncbi:uncharacterized protein [Choristoneura fumiferana]|uniref:uncharacterized protein n=1 Tax=Choristoneura fumiferana TaxID=7141 RepID=UPI003D15C4C6